jgi:uncharacterized protein (TIGR01777 family)
VREVAFDPAEQNGPWRAEVFSADGVVNLAGYPIASRWNDRVKKLLVSSRIDTTRALVAAVAEARAGGGGPRVYVSATGIGIFGDGGDSVLTEESPVGGDWLSDLAVAWEQEALKAAESGCRAVVLRGGLSLGDEGLLPKLTLPMKLFVGGPVGSGRQWVPWLHAADMVGAYRFALETDTMSGVYNDCAPEPVRVREFTAALGRRTRSWGSGPPRQSCSVPATSSATPTSRKRSATCSAGRRSPVRFG